MKKKELTLLFLTIEEQLLGKDVFLVPYYLGKVYNLNVKIVFLETETNHNIPSEYRGVKLHRIKPGKFHKETAFINYLFGNAKSIDNLMLFHLNYISTFLGIIYKLLNPKGYLYVKADGLGFLRPDTRNSKTILHKLIIPLYSKFLRSIDLLSVETLSTYELCMQNNLYGVNLKDKIKMMINGFDNDLFRSYNIKKKTYEEKEDVMITVARLGVYEKNNEILLEASKNINFKKWQLVFIGPLTKDFEKKVELFFLKHPSLSQKIIFTGMVTDKKELWDFYNKSKVFVLTSRIEGFAIVYPEALYFNNYIVTTEVGGAKETLKIGNGTIIAQNNSIELANVLQEVIDGKDIRTNINEDISWESLVRSLNLFENIKV